MRGQIISVNLTDAAMSQTQYVKYANRGFWAYDVVARQDLVLWHTDWSPDARAGSSD